MPVARFDDRTIRKTLSCPPGKDREEYRDDLLPGFFLRVTASGVRSFGVVAVLGRALAEGPQDPPTVRFTFGHYPEWSVAAAREHAKELLQQIAKGVDPRRPTPAPRGPTVGNLVETYCAKVLPSLSSKREAGIILKRFARAFGDRDPATLGRRELIEYFDSLEATSPSYAKQSLVYVRSMWKYSMRHGKIDLDNMPFVMFPTYYKSTPRERVLEPDEIRQLWEACGARVPDVRDIVRLRILTGKRTREVVRLRVVDLEEVDGVLWWFNPGWMTVNGRKEKSTKTGKPHAFPLVGLAREIVLARGSGAWIFPSQQRPGDHHQGIIAPAVASLREIVGFSFEAKDLRRTVATYLTSMGFPQVPNVAKFLAHSIPGMTDKHYDRYEYGNEKLQMANAWNARVEAMLRGEVQDNLRIFKRRA